MNLKLPSCPFCGARLGRLEAFVAKNKSIYRCVWCQKESEVLLNDRIYKLLWVTQILSILVFVASMLLGDGYTLMGLLFVIIVFSVFYAVSPYMVSLDEPRYEAKKPSWFMRFFDKKEKTKKIPRNQESFSETQSQDGNSRDIFSN